VDTPPLLSRKVGPKNQLNIPGEYMAALGIRTGEQVYLAINPDMPGTLIVVPEPLMAELFEKGWTGLH
jgi:hypothetical protein